MTSGGTTWTNTYNSDGLRTSRTNGTTTYNYYYEGSQLTEVTGGEKNIWIFYDAHRPIIIKYGDVDTYHYELNLQGDVIAILDSAGTRVVEYTYDAWGNILSITGSMKDTLGQANPLRYRGYVYDSETQLYYCQSRYYDPETGRFLNADAFASTGQGLLGNNMFAYCNNNPTNGCDPCGTCFHNWSFVDCPECAAFWDSFEGGWNAFSQCFSITGEIGYGFGASGKVGPVAVDVTAIIVGDEWTYNTDGTSESARKASLTVQAEVIDNVNLGVDLKYSVPLEAGKQYGLLCAEGGKVDAVVGAYAYNYGLGFNTTTAQDIELSLGLSAYLVMGGGFEISFNISKFFELLK